jgi:hypothetical protein
MTMTMYINAYTTILAVVLLSALLAGLLGRVSWHRSRQLTAVVEVVRNDLTGFGADPVPFSDEVRRLLTSVLSESELNRLGGFLGLLVTRMPKAAGEAPLELGFPGGAVRNEDGSGCVSALIAGNHLRADFQNLDAAPKVCGLQAIR